MVLLIYMVLFFYTCIQEDKKCSENQHLKYKVLSPMMKCIVYLAYYFNDQVLLSSIKPHSEQIVYPSSKIKTLHLQQIHFLL